MLQSRISVRLTGGIHALFPRTSACKDTTNKEQSQFDRIAFIFSNCYFRISLDGWLARCNHTRCTLYSQDTPPYLRSPFKQLIPTMHFLQMGSLVCESDQPGQSCCVSPQIAESQDRTNARTEQQAGAFDLSTTSGQGTFLAHQVWQEAVFKLITFGLGVRHCSPRLPVSYCISGKMSTPAQNGKKAVSLEVLLDEERGACKDRRIVAHRRS